MARPRTLVLIMAGGAGSRMELLTEVRAKPALPYAGVYRLIDFPLSHCMHSGLADVWVVEQFEPHSINEHLANGRPWDLDRTYGGLRIVQPHTGAEGSGWHQGNADAIFRNRKPIRDFDPDLIVVLSADHVYQLDYGEVIDAHLERAAEVTMVTTRVPLEKAGRHGTVRVDDQGKVTGFAYKPEAPDSDVVTTEVFVYNAGTLLATLDEIAAKGDGKAGDDNGALKDFGDELLPALVQRGRAYAYPLEGYWRDVGTIQSYWTSHMDLLGEDPKLNLDDPAWPIFTFGVQRMPARIHDTASIVDSLISPGCVVRGLVERSVLSPGVVVEEGAVVRDTIVLHDTVIRAGAVVECAIVDSAVQIGGGARVGSSSPRDGADAERDEPVITLVGQGAQIEDGAVIAGGERVKPGTRLDRS